MSERIEELIAREASGSLTPEEREALTRALEGDDLHRAVREGFRRIDAILKTMPAPPSGWDRLWRRTQDFLRRARRFMILLAGVGFAQALVAIAAFVVWRERYPIETALGLGIAFLDLPIFLVLAWLVGERRTRLMESTGDWLRLSREWAAQLDRGIRSLHISVRIFFWLALIWAVGAVVAAADENVFLLSLELVGVAVSVLGFFATRRDGRRRRAEREALREQFGV
jgi:hypothetical protein